LRAAVVFGHPHTGYGGTMHTKVVYQAAKALSRIGCAVLRFNFRGAGASAGGFTDGPGEMDDFRAALDFMRDRYPDAVMWAAGMAEALKRAPGIEPREIDDVILGCAMPEAEQGMNVARIASLRAGIPVDASAVTVNRFCSSGLQAIAYAAEHVMCGFASTILAGGTESMSLVPMGGHKIAPNPTLIDRYPDVYLSTGLVAENHARESGISRAEQDAFGLRSHQRALAAIDRGRFAEEI